MRAPIYMLAALGLAACTQQVPDSGNGVGFNDYNSYNAPAPVAPATGFSPDAAAAAIANAESGAVAPAPVAVQPGARPRGDAPAGIQQTRTEMDYVKSGVSDEQDFAAVAARETIESDKARIANNRAQYQVDQPGALPQRTGDTGPNIVEFALATNHAPGVQMYKRGGIKRDSSGPCSKYASPDLAQQDFLGKGGPDRDRMGVDPDGDGFACSWDPRPFRTALQ